MASELATTRWVHQIICIIIIVSAMTIHAISLLLEYCYNINTFNEDSYRTISWSPISSDSSGRFANPVAQSVAQSRRSRWTPDRDGRHGLFQGYLRFGLSSLGFREMCSRGFCIRREGSQNSDLRMGICDVTPSEASTETACGYNAGFRLEEEYCR